MTKRFCDWCGREIPPGEARGRVIDNYDVGMLGMDPVFTDHPVPFGVERIELCAEGPDSCWQSAARCMRLTMEDARAGAVRG